MAAGVVVAAVADGNSFLEVLFAMHYFLAT
jgi:hypothetical protein